jgi:hypothetical protein
MMLRRVVMLAFMLAFMLAVQPLAAQAPTIAASATGFRPLLPVLDDFGQVIPEDSIRLTMRPPNSRAISILATAAAGAMMFHLIRPKAPNDADCSIHEPCTAREKFYNSRAPLAGAVVGFILGYGLIRDERVDRWQAVEILRARRRYSRQSATPP